MTLSTPSFRAFLTTRYASARTQETYAEHIETLLRRNPSLRSRMPSKALLQAFLERPRGDGSQRSPTSRNQALSALKAYARYGLEYLRWDADPTEGLRFYREPARDPVVLSMNEVGRLIAATRVRSLPRDEARNLAIVVSLALTGLRVHELVGLNIGQVDFVSSTLLQVNGKGNTTHDQVLDSLALESLRRWLAVRAARASPDEQALFIAAHGGRLSIRSVQHLFVELRAAMGTAKKLTPHALRHSAATNAIALGVDLTTVSSLLRHSDLNVTKRYVRIVDSQRRAAVRLLAQAIPRELVATLARIEAPSTSSDRPSTQPVPPSSEGESATHEEPSCVDQRLDDTDIAV